MRNNWRNWRDQWLYVAYTRNGLEEFDLPTAAPVSHGISEATPNTDLVKNLKGRIMSRKAMGLTRAMVTRDAVRRRISPLRNRPRLACNYYGDNDAARTFLVVNSFSLSILHSIKLDSHRSHRSFMHSGGQL